MIFKILSASVKLKFKFFVYTVQCRQYTKENCCVYHWHGLRNTEMSCFSEAKRRNGLTS